jgi:hypothetical protein
MKYSADLEDHDTKGKAEDRKQKEGPCDAVLHGDMLARIMSYLAWKEVMNCRVVNHVWREAARNTPIEELYVDREDVALALQAISLALPGLRKLTFFFETFNFDVNDEIFALAQGFRKLSSLRMIRTKLEACVPLIMQLNNLRSLNLDWNMQLVWNLADLSAIPRLKKLRCKYNYQLTGDLSSLQVLCETMTICDLWACRRVTGDLHILSSFPHLEILSVFATNVTGDIRKIGSAHFPLLKKLDVSSGVLGGKHFTRIADAPEVMQAWYSLETKHPGIFCRQVELAIDAPERQQYLEIDCPYSKQLLPLTVQMISFGPRLGWRWTNGLTDGSCDIHWFDDEPSRSANGYDEYVRALERANSPHRHFRGFLVPPTPQEHRRICAAYSY